MAGELGEVVALELVSVDGVAFESVDFGVDDLPLVDDEDERESVTYQPLPLKTMPTGWMTLRSVPPHCSHVVKGASEKL